MVIFLSALYFPSCHLVLNLAGFIQTLALPASEAGRLPMALQVGVGDGLIPGSGGSWKASWFLVCFPASSHCLCTVALLYWDTMLLAKLCARHRKLDLNYLMRTAVQVLLWFKFKGRNRNGGIPWLSDVTCMWQRQDWHQALGSNRGYPACGYGVSLEDINAP